MKKILFIALLLVFWFGFGGDAHAQILSDTEKIELEAQLQMMQVTLAQLQAQAGQATAERDLLELKSSLLELQATLLTIDAKVTRNEIADRSGVRNDLSGISGTLGRIDRGLITYASPAPAPNYAGSLLTPPSSPLVQAPQTPAPPYLPESGFSEKSNLAAVTAVLGTRNFWLYAIPALLLGIIFWRRGRKILPTMIKSKTPVSKAQKNPA